ncbi:MAG: dTDP-4-dehydrorhamnose reductase [Campylobacteraceae bacterium]|jgi:dTDP-4-dehydrorhamnose reductase|nr:dTDP-4-dehydrorhamnose reductase [Campylobacteraceae bacterium]
MLNILVTGADGQLGNSIKRYKDIYPDYNFIFANQSALDITKNDILYDFIKQNSINALINCAAYTAVDAAENDEAKARLINHNGVLNLALAAKETGIKFVHISTDYVFEGRNYKPYTETDGTNPLSVYGKTKLAGENALKNSSLKNSIIIRTSWLYSEFGKNFLKTMLNLAKTKNVLKVVNDQIGTPTYAPDLARAVLEILPLVQNNETQIYHYSNEGVASWYDFAWTIMKEADLPCKIEPVNSGEYKTAAQRPFFSLLDKTKIKNEYGINIPHWRDSLDVCLRNLGIKN